MRRIDLNADVGEGEETDEALIPLNGPVDIRHWFDNVRTRIVHSVLSHLVALAEFATLGEALEYVEARKLELDRIECCPCKRDDEGRYGLSSGYDCRGKPICCKNDGWRGHEI